MQADYHGKTAYRGRQEDGRHLYIFSQSLIKTVEICPERGRRTLLQLHPRTETDSTAAGTAVHLAIELCVQDMIDGQGPWHLADMHNVACQHFNDLMDWEGSRWVKVKQAKTVHQYIWNCLGAFQLDVLPTLDPVAVEMGWGPFTIHEDAERVIQLQGTIDYVDRNDGASDWKTSSRAWEAWEHQRWDVQPTAYTWALQQLAEQDGITDLSPLPWTWHVFQTNGQYQRIETTRGPSDWAWLKERVKGLALTMEADLPEWFKNDGSALCSERYCEAWLQCKGKHFADDTPK